MDKIRDIQRISELDKEGKSIKDNLKGAIQSEKGTKSKNQKISVGEKKSGSKMPGGGTKDKRQYAPTGSERILSEPRVVRF